MVGDGGHGIGVMRNVWIEYLEEDYPPKWEFSDIKMSELSGVNGQLVQVSNFPVIQEVRFPDDMPQDVNVLNFPESFLVGNFPAVQDVNLQNFPDVVKVSDVDRLGSDIIIAGSFACTSVVTIRAFFDPIYVAYPQYCFTFPQSDSLTGLMFDGFFASGVFSSVKGSGFIKGPFVAIRNTGGTNAGINIGGYGNDSFSGPLTVGGNTFGFIRARLVAPF
jgi:hypothetical protein